VRKAEINLKVVLFVIHEEVVPLGAGPPIALATSPVTKHHVKHKVPFFVGEDVDVVYFEVQSSELECFSLQQTIGLLC
jgi:hypothetical protein